MADTQTTDLPVLTSLASGDVFHVIDVSDTTDDPEGSDKQITATNLAAGLAAAGGLATDAEVTAAVAAHTGDTSAAHAASAISFSATGTIAATDVQAAVAEVATDAATALSTHEADTTSVHGIADTSALETTTGSASKVSTHAALTSSVHGISTFGASLVDDADASAARTTLGLGTAATAAQADLLARANHTGTQAAATISDFSEAVDDEVATLLTAGANITLTYNDAGNTLTIAASGGGGSVGTRFHPAAGQWIAPPSRIWTTSTHASVANVGHNRLLFLPVPIFFTVSVDEMSIELTVAGDASSVIRLGLWSDSGSGRPGTLLEQGTAAADSTGVKQIGFTSRSLTAGTYWLGHAWQNGVPTTQPTYRAFSPQEAMLNTGLSANSGVSPNAITFLTAGVTGSFASNPTVTPTAVQLAADALPARILLRVA